MAKEMCLVTTALGFVKWNNKILDIIKIFLFKTVVQTVISYWEKYTTDAVMDMW